MTLASTAPTTTHAGDADGVFRLLVLHSPSASTRGHSHALGSDPVHVGRLEGGIERLCLDDAELSRTHATIERAGPTREPHGLPFTIRDEDSRNGTFVSGARVTVAEIDDGDVFRVGSHVLCLQLLTLEDCNALLLPPPRGEPIVGDSVAMMRMRKRIAQVASSARSVLLLGESGVGKELVASEIHRASERTGPLVAVNCASLPEQLIESELFGHAKGAFTGATNRSDGLFGEAEGGTLFLDEIGEMVPAMQAKLLRALATGEVRAVGETKSRTVDVRVVAATNVDLDRAVENGAFRGDLYARLMGGIVNVPPLRARREDILPLVEHFMARRGAEVSITPDAAEALLLHEWRYNVRELEQMTADIELRKGGELALADLPVAVQKPVADRLAKRPTEPTELPLALRIPRRGTPTAEHLAEALRAFDGSVARVAEFFGKDRRQIYRWAEALGVDVDAFRS